MSINFRAPTFMTSAARLSECPTDSGAEVAFAGRSNTGKSSTLNALTGYSRLAYTGKKPGRTRLINFFGLGGDRYRLVDLPGYGYAEASRAERAAWWRLTKQFIKSRRSLCGVILVVDSRHAIRESDWDFVSLAAEAGLSVCMLLNRADQLGHQARMQSLRRARMECAARSPLSPVNAQLFSATKRIGTDEARASIAKLMIT
jgi:GTP-binding protein